MSNETQPRDLVALETPQQVEIALDEAYSGFFNPDKVKAELAQARKLYPTYFESQHELQLDTEISAYMAAKNKAEWSEKKPSHLTSIFVSTLAPFKQSVFNSAAAKYGLGIHYQKEEMDEEFMHHFADKKEVFLDWYPFHIASQKALRSAPSSHPWRLNEPRIAIDTIASAGDEVLHKPKDLKTAKEVLHKISGSEIVVRTGIYLDMTTHSGEYLDWLGGSVIKIPIANLTEPEIDAFLSENHLQALTVAGGVDYSSEAGQTLIDQNRLIELVPLEIGITDAHLNNELLIDWKNSIKMKKSATSGLVSHLRGAPIQPIDHIFKNIQTIYSSL